ncbi:hypothetical protein RCL1_001164 [Eukaryota sp. TZLM3-RCL]
MGQLFSLPAERSETLSKTRASFEAVRSDTVYLYGTGISGRTRTTPELLDRVKDFSVADVCASVDFVLLLTSEGKVMAYGRNDKNQLGIEGVEVVVEPVEVPIPTKIAQLACGLFHTAVIGDDGSVWTWGCNTKGQCGVGKISAFTLPCRIDIGNRRAKFVACGLDYTLILTESGEIIAFGDNQYLQCGLPAANSSYPKPTLLPVTLDKNEVITHVSCGTSTSFFTTSCGRVFGFGSNSYKQLPGVEGNVSKPVVLSVFEKLRVASVSVGWYCAAVLLDCGGIRSWHWKKNEGVKGENKAENEPCSPTSSPSPSEAELLTPQTVVGEDSVHQHSAVQVRAMAESFVIITDENAVYEVSRVKPVDVVPIQVPSSQKVLRVRTGPLSCFLMTRLILDCELPPTGCFRS